MPHRYTWYAILLILLCFGAFLRIYRMHELSTFRGDQAIELSSVADILEGDFTLIGIKTSISEVRNGAVMYYVMAPFLYVFRYHPLAGGVVQTLLSVGAIAIVYFLGTKYFNLLTGIFAGFFLAVSPVLVQFSRQTLLAFYPLFFCSVSFFLILSLVQKFEKWKALVLGVLLGWMLQVHYSTLSVVLFSVIFPLFFLRKTLIRYYLFLIIGFLIGFSPMLLFEIRNSFFNTHMLLSYIAQAKSSQYTMLSPFMYWTNVLSSIFFAGQQWLAYLLVGILGISFFVSQGERNMLVLAWTQILFTVVVTIFFKVENLPHYAIPAVVPLSLLFGYSLSQILKNISLPKASYSVIGCMILLYGLSYPVYGFHDSHGFTMEEGWNLPGVEKAAHSIAQDVGEKKFNVVMLIDGETQAYPLRYLLRIQGKQPLAINQYDIPERLYVVVKPGIDIRNSDVWEIRSFGAFTINKTWDLQHGILLYRLVKKSV